MTDSEEGKEGKALVRELLIARVSDAGLCRAKGVTIEAHEAYMRRLADQLAYMAGENLMTLADLVIENGQGPSRTIWPPEVLIMHFARGLQTPPPAEHRIITSWLASVKGPEAEAGGYLTELYLHLVRSPRPPSGIEDRLIREEAQENRRRIELINGRVERGTVKDEDRRWLERYLAAERTARQIVEQGAQKRAAEKGQAA